jgi:hypothetical protein
MTQEALKRIAEKLRRAGASLPAPELTGTIEGSVVTGLCIALALVEGEIEALAQPEEEPLHPVHIGVDVTREGTAVTAFYRKPDAVMEMFYSQFHPMAQPPQRTEQEPQDWKTPSKEDAPLVKWAKEQTTPPQRRARGQA